MIALVLLVLLTHVIQLRENTIAKAFEKYYAAQVTKHKRSNRRGLARTEPSDVFGDSIMDDSDEGKSYVTI